MTGIDIKRIVSEMTLEEKAGICSGFDSWNTKAIERLQIPSIMVSDGPHGLRTQKGNTDLMGINESIEAVCFPAACATAASFDRNLLFEMGQSLGRECQAEGVSVLLGPAVCIKRSPLCGRNFEYISEDPFLAGELAASYIEGVQSQGVGTSIKHFACNNQEYERMTGSSELDERTFREIYLPAFEIAVKKVQPWTVMCSYNKINGVFASENKKLLTDILRAEWGFEGLVMSDWGAVSDRVAGIVAGLDLEMPTSHGMNDRLIVQAVKEGKLAQADLDTCVERILSIVYRAIDNKRQEALDLDADHRKAVQIAEQSIVLLKNDKKMLPLKKTGERVAFIGDFADKPRYQGGGSSHINAHHVSSALEIVHEEGYAISYSRGFSSLEDVYDGALAKQAVEVARTADKVVIFAGLPDSFESEGYDRTHMNLPHCQNRVIEEIIKVQPNCIVVLHNGSPVTMPWVNEVSAIVELYLGGEGIGEATVNMLYGKVNPGGKLAETFPLRLEDTPSYLTFPGKRQKVHYSEGVFVGYRYYDAKKLEVLFPFGHGLSYTTFALSNLHLDHDSFTSGEGVTVSVDVSNTGDLAGKEVVQLYVRDNTDVEIRPEKELKGFVSVFLHPGETKTVTMQLDKRAFTWYCETIGDWYAATGDYEILIGDSSQNITLCEHIHWTSEKTLPLVVDKDTMLGQFTAISKARKYVDERVIPLLTGIFQEDGSFEPMMEAMLKFLPLRSIKSFGNATNEDIDKIIDDLNVLVK